MKKILILSLVLFFFLIPYASANVYEDHYPSFETASISNVFTSRYDSSGNCYMEISDNEAYHGEKSLHIWRDSASAWSIAYVTGLSNYKGTGDNKLYFYYKIIPENTSTSGNTLISFVHGNAAGTAESVLNKNDFTIDGEWHLAEMSLYDYSVFTGFGFVDSAASRPAKLDMYIDCLSFGSPFQIENSNINWNQSTYESGDTAQINYSYPSYIESNENYINVRSYNPVSSTWELEEMIFVSAESGSVSYPVPSYTSRQFRAELMTRQSVLFTPTEIGNATMQMTSSGASLQFDKGTYGRNENFTFTYVNMPTDSIIQFSGPDHFGQWTVTGNGSAGYQMTNGPYSTTYTITAYDSNNNELGSDTAWTEAAPVGDCTIHGRVKDSETGAVIEGAEILIAARTATTDSSGDYSLTIPKGTWNIEVSKAGYITKTVSDFTFSSSSYSYNPTLQPNPVAGSTLYGDITNKETGGSISNAVIAVWNDSVTKTAVSSKGSFTIIGLTDGASYTISASQSNFENYQSTFTFSSTSNTYSIQMIPKPDDPDDPDDPIDPGIDPDDPEDPDDDSGGETPGQKAARETVAGWYGDIPVAFSLVTTLFVFQLLKRGTK